MVKKKTIHDSYDYKSEDILNIMSSLLFHLHAQVSAPTVKASSKVDKQ